MSLFADRPSWPSSSFMDSNLFGSETSGSSSDDFSSWFMSRSDSSSLGRNSFFENGLLSSGKKDLDPTESIVSHLDSLLHDLTVFDRPSRRLSYNGSELRREDWKKERSEKPGPTRPKEFIIPIEVETKRRGINSDLPSSRKAGDSLESNSTSQSSKQKESQNGAIQIPILRVSSRQDLYKPLLLSPVSADIINCETPSSSRFGLPNQTSPSASTKTCLPNTLPSRSKPALFLQPLDQRQHTQSMTHHTASPKLPSKQTTPSALHPNNTKIVEEIEEEETIIRSRRPRQHSSSLSFSCAKQPAQTDLSTDAPASSKTGEESSSRSDVRNDATRLDGDRRGEREDPERSSSSIKRQAQCSSATGLSHVTPSPSYPVYSLLKAGLANTGRQVDYIRGDGNCFFRALSKEMYGSEDFHVDWRDAVCDLISNYPKVFSPFVDGCCVEAHVHLMRKLGSWATSCEIYGAATLLRREVYVLAPSPSGEKEYHWLLFRPRSLACKSRSGSGGEESEEDDEDEEEDEGGVHPCYITFCLTNGNHYDRITPLVAGVCNCQMDPPFLNGEPLRAEFCPREEEVVSQRDVCWWPS